MVKLSILKCPTCGKNAHNFTDEEVLNCVPPKNVLRFGDFEINRAYRDELFLKHPNYTAEEIMGSFLGHNPIFPSQDEWLSENEEAILS